MTQSPLCIESIPVALRDASRWLCWRYAERDGRRTKVPVSPLTGDPTDVTDPANLVPFTAALEHAGGFDGIGFALGEGFAGVDLDACFAADGQPYNWARYIIADLASYAERSPSGNGIHVLVRGAKPDGPCRRDMRGGHVEVYGGGRYFTVTGQRHNGAPAEVQYRERELHALHATLFPSTGPPPVRVASAPVCMDDQELLHRAMAAANGAQFTSLWQGERGPYPSESEGDLALCGLLAFWTGPDPERIERIVNDSPRGQREKWRDRPDYRRRTIAKALEGRSEFHTPRQTAAPAEPLATEYAVLAPSTWAAARERVSRVRWLWEDWLPRGYVTVLAGDTGHGKTWIALCLAGSVIEGNPWPNQTAGPERGRVFWVEAEGRLRVNFERAETMGVSPEGFLGMPDPFRALYLDNTDDFANLEAMVQATRPDLLVVDSWNRGYRGKEGDAEVRHTLDRLQRLVEQVDGACLLLQHVRKPTELDQDGSRVHRVRGSSALCNAALSVIGIEAAPGVAKHWALSVWKGNLCQHDPKPVGFTIEDGQVLFGEAPAVGTGTETRFEEAKEFLVSVLSDGPQRVELVKAEAKKLGIAEETLLRAKRAVAEPKRQTGTETVWLWGLRGYWKEVA